MEAFELEEILGERGRSARPYIEFLRKESMSAGIYVLPAGGVDGQKPHTEDELYYVLSGRATVMVGGEERPVRAGSAVFVAAEVEHRFHSIEEELVLLVFFAPAEYSQANGAS
ncbi:MAG TPA: cupin domain-containing protein [Chloroflexia bacterium]|nr:cupin domain-containing protein [Chloroflexia bacterium]